MCDRKMAVNIQLIGDLNEFFLALEQKCKGCVRVFWKKVCYNIFDNEKKL